MKLFLKTGASAAILFAFAVAAPSLSQAADVADPGCSLHGAVQLGYMFTDNDISATGTDENTDWQTPFGEGAGLVTCNAWNFQGDFALYAHESEFDSGGTSVDLSGYNGHFGGAAFWRSPDAGSLGLSASIMNLDEIIVDNDYWRVGAFGEFYVGDQFTLGGSAHYFSGKDFADKDHDGFELTANAKFYVMPELSLSVQGDFMTSELSISGTDADFDGFAITGEAEYLVWDEGISLFGGARYAERQLSASGTEIDFDDLQVYVGLEFAFGAAGGSLADRDRSGPIDNTSTMFEKLPSWVNEAVAAIP